MKPSRVELRRTATRASILDGAREAITEQGYQSFSMRKLAARLGFSPGALYLYFDTREQLLNCLVDEAFDKLLDALNHAHDSDDPIGSLHNKLRAYIDFGLRFPQHYQFAFGMRPIGERASPERRPHESFDVLRDSVRTCIEAGSDWPDVETTSQILWATIHGITSLLIVRSNFPWVEREDLIEGVLNTAIAGLDRSPTGETGKEDENL
jgi:AcrR family transcriptional regulator